MRECAVRFVQLSTVTWLPSRACSVKYVGLSEWCASDIVQLIDADHFGYRHRFSHANSALKFK